MRLGEKRFFFGSGNNYIDRSRYNFTQISNITISEINAHFGVVGTK